MYNSEAFSTSPVLCSRHLYQVLRHFHRPERNPCTSCAVTPLSLPPSLAVTSLLSVSRNLPVLDISYKWNHTMCGLLGLASSVNVSEALPVVGHITTSFVWPNEIPLSVESTFCFSVRPLRIYGWFPPLNSAVISICVQIFV